MYRGESCVSRWAINSNISCGVVRFFLRPGSYLGQSLRNWVIDSLKISLGGIMHCVHTAHYF